MIVSLLSVIYFGWVVIADNRTDLEMSPRFLGVHDLIYIKKAPHQVSIQYSGNHICSGSIISKNWVITAARDLHGPKCCYSIRSGSLYHDKDGTIHKIDRIIIHEHFKIEQNGFIVNDIALIHIPTPFIIDSTRKPILLGNINQIISRGAHLFMYGWGDTTSNAGRTLRVFKTKAIDKVICNRTYDYYGGIYDNQGCTDDFYGKTSMCRGDVGGPIINKYSLVGILSFAEGCGRAKYPNVFTEITAHRFWINRHSGI